MRQLRITRTISNWKEISTISNVLVVGDTIRHGKDFVDEMGITFTEKTATLYRNDDTKFRFATIEHLKSDGLKGQGGFTVALCSRNISLGDYHKHIRPKLENKSSFTVF